MSTKFLLRAIALLLVCCLSGVLFYTAWISRAKRVDVNGLFYFLVSEEKHIEASTELVKLDGGAGYLLRKDEKEYVALSVYEREEDCETVRKRLQSQGESAKTVRLGASSLLFKGKQKANSDMYLGALRTLKSYIFLLGECITRLEKQLTQESCKRLLSTLQNQLIYAGREYEKYEKYAAVCLQSAKELEKIGAGIIYAKDLRYLRCWQAEQYARLCKQFK